MFRLVRPEPALLSAFGGGKRLATRPLYARDANFDDAFDDDTLFFDAFREASGDKIVLVGPALFNVADGLKAMRARALPSGQSCRFSILELDRHTRVVVDAPAGAKALAFEGPLGAFEVVVQENFAAAFTGTRLLFTKSKNNAIEWILDWIRFHRDLHGVDAALIYDNNSTDYDSETLLDALRGVSGLKSAFVVQWPFKFGPQGAFEGFWDSDFCEYGALEHARWRFAPYAQGAMNADIDELLVSVNGQSIFDALARSRLGVMRYPGHWVVGVEGDPCLPPEQLRRHVDYHIALKPEYARRFGLFAYDRLRCPPKWTVAPARCPPRAQWKNSYDRALAEWAGSQPELLVPPLPRDRRQLEI